MEQQEAKEVTPKIESKPLNAQQQWGEDQKTDAFKAKQFNLTMDGSTMVFLTNILKKFVYPEYSYDFLVGFDKALKDQWYAKPEPKQE